MSRDSNLGLAVQQQGKVVNFSLLQCSDSRLRCSLISLPMVACAYIDHHFKFVAENTIIHEDRRVPLYKEGRLLFMKA